MTLITLPLLRGSTGPDVTDLQRRLCAVGFQTSMDGVFGEATARAVQDFQQSRGLRVSGNCGPTTWSALIESDFHLGDRLLCLRSPMLRGDDVGELQLRLGVMGFDPGRVDGILGPMTQHAVAEFQRNAGLVSDAVCGPDTVAALVRLEGRGGRSSVTSLRERENLRRRSSTLSNLRLAVGSADAGNPLVPRVVSELQRAGSKTLLLEGIDWSMQAVQANTFSADAFLGLTILPDDQVAEAYFFAAKGYESVGGRSLAELIMAELPASPGWGIGTVSGMREPILRETKPPAVLVRLGDREGVESSMDLVVAAIHTALARWVEHRY